MRLTRGGHLQRDSPCGIATPFSVTSAEIIGTFPVTVWGRTVAKMQIFVKTRPTGKTITLEVERPRSRRRKVFLLISKDGSWLAST